MRKLKLELDSLRVDAFEVGEPAGHRGTVEGRGHCSVQCVFITEASCGDSQDCGNHTHGCPPGGGGFPCSALCVNLTDASCTG